MMSPLKPSFLYVDDETFSREVMQILLETIMGYTQVSYFKNSQNFMAQLQALSYTPTVIFLDIKVKPYNGYEMLEMLRADPNFRNTKIIAVTANVMLTDVEAMKAAGFNGLIGKPLIHRIFPELVNKILNDDAVWYIS